MNKFKIGDRVRCTESTGTDEVTPGQEFVVSNANPLDLVGISRGYGFRDSWFERILPFHVGQRWRSNTDGTVITILSIEGNNITSKGSWCCYWTKDYLLENFEPLPEEQLEWPGTINTQTFSYQPAGCVQMVTPRGIGNLRFYQSDKIIKPKKTIMRTLNNMMKKLLSADTQKHIKVGFINGDLELTEKGKDALLSLLYTEKTAELSTLADEEIAETENK